MGAASVALVAAGVVVMSQPSAERGSAAIVTHDDVVAFGSTSFTAPPVPTVAPLILPPALTMPSGAVGARLAALPDALLNDHPDLRTSASVEVRGRAGFASAQGPLVLRWSEDGYWYELSTTRLTLARLLEIASALE